jgi:antirestriction protein ArdC
MAQPTGSRDVYQDVTNRIVIQMENAARWEKPWRAGMSIDGSIMPTRPISITNGKSYRGVNVPLLWSSGFASPAWGTFKAWQAKGCGVRKGERGTQIIFWKSFDKMVHNDKGEDVEESFAMARGYYVLNAEQVDGYVAPVISAPLNEPERNAIAESFVKSTGARIVHGGDRAYYTTGDDHIQMPHLVQFNGTKTSTAVEAYYRTLLHELRPRVSRTIRLSARRGDQINWAREKVKWGKE